MNKFSFLAGKTRRTPGRVEVRLGGTQMGDGSEDERTINWV